MTANRIYPLLKDGEASEMLGCSKSTFWRRVADGTIPKPLKIGGMSRWPQSEVIEVIQKAKVSRDGGQSTSVPRSLSGGN